GIGSNAGGHSGCFTGGGAGNGRRPPRPFPAAVEGVRSGGFPRSPCGLAVLLHHRLEALPLAGRGAGLEGDGLLADLGEAVLLPPIERSGDGAARGRWVAALTDQLGDAVRGEGLATRVELAVLVLEADL